MYNKFNVRTINNHCVSLYNCEDGSFTVFSYNTPVFRVDADNTFHRLWAGWSVTTQRDINSCVNVGMNKKTWEAMLVEN